MTLFQSMTQIVGIPPRLTEITPNTKRSVAPFLVLNTSYLETATHVPMSLIAHAQSTYTFINLFTDSIFGLWIRFLPLCIRTDSSLEKGIAIYSSENRVLDSTPLSVEGVCQSRIGLIGNPSDGYFGQTISITLDNFATKVVLLKSDRLTIVPHPVYPAVFRH